MQPKTGEILAMASRPTFDVTKPDLSDESKLGPLPQPRDHRPLRAGLRVQAVHHRRRRWTWGSSHPNTWWYDSGVVNVDGWTIRNWDLSANGSQTVQQILTKSLNTGAAWLAQPLRPGRFYDYVHASASAQPPAAASPARSAGRVRTPDNDPDDWRPVDMATNSFGQGISVTPLQMAMALAAIANDGMLMKPQLVKEIVGPARHAGDPSRRPSAR